MKKHALILSLSLFCGMAAAQEPPPQTWVDLPLLDVPFNTDSSYFPATFSMRQSMQLSNSYYQNIHRWIAGDPTEDKTNFREFVYLALFDYIGSTTPLSSGWVHEEWHRSVLTRRRIGSFNDMNTFPFGQSVIAVSQVDDQDLVNLKRDHPAEQVRLSAAGMESQIQQNLSLQENLFFKKSRSEDRPLYWLNAVGVIGYMSTCASTESDRTTDDENRDDGADIPRRDFTGLDCNAWVYDLFRPDEPYTARGVHPSGVGIDRYIRFSDLNEKEQNFLKLQARYSLLNLADPFLIGWNEFHTEIKGRPVRWNAKLNHMLTSFGATIDAHLFLDLEGDQYLVTWHNGMTDTRYMPGLSVKQVDLALNEHWFATPALTAWQQPKDQRLEGTSTDILVDASLELAYRSSRWVSYYFGVEAKNKGWVAGNVYLDDNVTGWAGLRATVY